MSSWWKYTSITQILLFIFWESSTPGLRKTKQNKTGPNTVPRKNLAGRQVCLAFRIPLSDRLEGIRNEIENGDCLSSETVTCWLTFPLRHNHWETLHFCPISAFSSNDIAWLHDCVLPFLLFNDLTVKHIFTVNAGSPGTLEYHTLSHADGYFQCSLTLLRSAMFSILNSVEENI